MNNEIRITASSAKHLNMLGKINPAFKLIQVCIKKELKEETRKEYEKKLKETNTKLIYIKREYDGTERYWICYEKDTNIETLPKDKSIIYL